MTDKGSRLDDAAAAGAAHPSAPSDDAALEGDSMPPVSSWWQRLSPTAREVLVDTLVAVGIMAFMWVQVSLSATLFIAQSWTGQLTQGYIRPQMTPLLLLMLALCSLPLAARRQVPEVVLTATCVFCLATQAISGATVAIAGPLVALYTLTSRVSRRGSLVATVVVAAAFVVVPLLIDQAVTLMRIVEYVALVVAASALGAATNSRNRLVEEARQRAEQADIARREAELARAEAERTREQEAARRVEEERVSIAREVHDITAHTLSAVAIEAAAAERLVERDPAKAKEVIGAIRTTAKDSLRELRLFIAVLQQPTGGEGDSRRADAASQDAADGDGDGRRAPRTPTSGTERLGEVVETMREAGLAVQVDTADYDRTAVPSYIDVALFKVVREAGTNAMRYAPGSAVTVRLACEGRLAVARVENGPSPARSHASGSAAGADAHAVAGGGRGIPGMRERAEVLGGTLSAGPQADGGFLVEARIPLRVRPKAQVKGASPQDERGTR